MTYKYKIRSADVANGTFVVEFEGLNPISCWIPHDDTGFLTGEALDAAIQRLYPWDVQQKQKFASFTNGAEIESLIEAPSELLKNAVTEQNIRRQRNLLLLHSDWTQLPNARLIPEQKTAWEIYRQALRDVPTQAGFPTTIDWPVTP